MDLFEEDVIDLLKAFEKKQVRYLMVGGFAVNYYGYNRTTADLDLWVDVSAENQTRLLDALDDLGFDTEELSKTELTGKPPIDIPLEGFKIELINFLGDTLDFEEAYLKSHVFLIEEISIRVLHINHLIHLKESSSRPKDLLDAEELKRIRDRGA